MNVQKRVFILGAGFSKPAGMPLATELLPLLVSKVELEEMRQWLDDLCGRLAWLGGHDEELESSSLNIEQVFHHAQFDIEVRRLRQHLAEVGRGDGPDTPWNRAESIRTWLSYFEEDLCDAIFEADSAANLAPIDRWAEALGEQDVVLTFNYDTLVERALEGMGKPWNHGVEQDGGNGVPIFKLHGSIDWIVTNRSESPSNLDLLFDKPNVNRPQRKTGHVEDDLRLWRCPRERLSTWVENRDWGPGCVGIGGLGAYKELHQIPGLGLVWARGMQALCRADLIVVVGFSMSDFDAMARMQFVEVARSRPREGRPIPVIVIDPYSDAATEDRFRRVFRLVRFIKKAHEAVDWSCLT